MSAIGPPLLAGLIAGMLSAVLLRPILLRLPEPAVPDPTKLPYAALARRPFLIGVAAANALGVGLPWAILPTVVLPLWCVLGTVGVWLAAVDARTTWLPLPLTRLAWLLAVVAAVAAGGLTWSSAGRESALGLIGRVLLGAAVAGGLYFAVWLLTRGGFGFGDVRFAPLIGAAGAAVSLPTLFWALALGSLVGGVQGIVRLLLRRREPFPYAPALLAGGYLAAVALSSAVRT